MVGAGLIRRHRRFLAAAALGCLALPLSSLAGLSGEIRLVVAGDVFFAAFLAMVLPLLLRRTPDGYRERARVEDEGILIISALTVLAIGFSLVSILTLLNKHDGANEAGLVLAILSVPLGWLTLHTLAAQRYADLYYAQGEETGEGEARDAGGLDFPGDTPPGPWEFLYFAFVIGMTAQTSDVSVTTREMRQTALAHSLASFVFNTVLVAVAVNAAIAGAG